MLQYSPVHQPVDPVSHSLKNKLLCTVTWRTGIGKTVFFFLKLFPRTERCQQRLGAERNVQKQILFSLQKNAFRVEISINNSRIISPLSGSAKKEEM